MFHADAAFHVATTAVLVIAVVFSWSAVSKARHFGLFVSSLEGYGVHAGAAHRLALAIVAAELLVVALTLVSPVLAMIFAVMLLALFAAATGRTLRSRSAESYCACFGQREPLSWLHVIRDVALIAIGLVGLVGADTATVHLDDISRAVLPAVLLALLTVHIPKARAILT